MANLGSLSLTYDAFLFLPPSSMEARAEDP